MRFDALLCVAYDLSPDLRIVRALRGAYLTVVGRGLPQADGLMMCGVNMILREAHLPPCLTERSAPLRTPTWSGWSCPKSWARQRSLATILDCLGQERSA